MHDPHLEVLAVDAFADVGADDAGLEALTVLLEAAGLLAVAALVVPRLDARHHIVLRSGGMECSSHAAMREGDLLVQGAKQ